MEINIRGKIEDILYSVGLDLTEELSDQMDSVTFVTVIIEIEQTFGIEVPDEWLDFTRLTTIDDIVSMVEQLTRPEAVNS